MKYETKPIDFTGCHPVIAEHLKRGEKVRCWVWDDDKERGSGPLYICAYIKEEGQYPYKTDVASWWTHAEPIPQKIRRVKRASEIIKMLEDEGWVYVNQGYSRSLNPKNKAVGIAYIHEIAGHEVFETGTVKNTARVCLNEDWIEEVPE